MAPSRTCCTASCDHVVVAPAEARDQREVLRLRQLLRGDDLAHPRRVRRARLLAEDVLVGVDRRRQVLRPEARRGRQQHHVDAAVDHLVVGIEAEEGVVDLHAAPEFRAAPQAGRGALDDRFVDVGDGRQLVVRVRAQRLPGRAAAAPAGAHQTNLDGVRDRLGGDDARKAGHHAHRRPSRSS